MYGLVVRSSARRGRRSAGYPRGIVRQTPRTSAFLLQILFALQSLVVGVTVVSLRGARACHEIREGRVQRERGGSG